MNIITYIKKKELNLYLRTFHKTKRQGQLVTPSDSIKKKRNYTNSKQFLSENRRGGDASQLILENKHYPDGSNRHCKTAAAAKSLQSS